MRLTQKIICVLLSALVLAYAGGLGIAKHLCKDTVVDIATNAPAKKCKGAAQVSEILPVSGQSFSKKSCCSDEFTLFKSNSFSKFSTTSVPLMSFAVLLDYPLLFDFEHLITKPVGIDANAPPQIHKALYIVLEQIII